MKKSIAFILANSIWFVLHAQLSIEGIMQDPKIPVGKRCA